MTVRTVKIDEFEQMLWNLPEVILCDDELAEWISAMRDASTEGAFEEAGEIKDIIIDDFLKKEPIGLTNIDPCLATGRTLQAIHDDLRAGNIRLNWEKMDLPKYLDLLQVVHGEVFEKRDRGQRADTRQITAKWMASLGILPQSGERGKRRPNRAFMDVLGKYNKQLAASDLLDRSLSKLKQALAKGHASAVDTARKEVQKYVKWKREI